MMGRFNVHSSHLWLVGGVFFYISQQEESLILMEIRQNLTGEVTQELFHHFSCAVTVRREDSGQGREAE